MPENWWHHPGTDRAGSGSSHIPQDLPKTTQAEQVGCCWEDIPWEKKVNSCFPMVFFSNQRVRREEQHMKLQAALGAWPEGKLELGAPGMIRDEKLFCLSEAEPQVGFAPSRLISALQRGTEGWGTGLSPSAASVGCLGSCIPCFSQRWPLSR